MTKNQQSNKKLINKSNEGQKTLIILFIVGTTLLVLLLVNAPKLSDQDKEKFLRIPRNADDLRLINDVIQTYSKDNSIFILVAFCFMYIFLQSFAIPGPIFLSILSGAIFGAIKGFLLVCFCATTGATNCYLLSNFLAKGLVKRKFPTLLEKFGKMVESNRDNLFYYMLFLRLTPLVPNFFVNIASPIVGIPVKIFSVGTLLGLIPFNIIHVNTGLKLQEIAEFGVKPAQVIFIACFGFIALIPTFFKKKIQEMSDKQLEKKNKQIKKE